MHESDHFLSTLSVHQLGCAFLRCLPDVIDAASYLAADYSHMDAIEGELTRRANDESHIDDVDDIYRRALLATDFIRGKWLDAACGVRPLQQPTDETITI